MAKPDKKLQELDSKITSISNVIEETESRRDHVQENLAKATTEIPQVMEQFKRAMVEGADLVELDRRRKALTDQRERDELLLKGLTEKLEELEIQLSEAIEARNSRFRQLVASWLTKESEGYNKAVDSLRTHLKRFFAAYRIVSDLGLQSVFQEILGNGVYYLGRSRLIELGNGFGPNDLSQDSQSAKIRPGPQLIEELFREVTG